MKTYEYRGYDRQGHSCRGLMEGVSLKDVREKLAAEGILAEKLSVSGASPAFSIGTRAAVYRELGALLAAGMTLVKALDLLIQSPEMAECRSLLAGIRDRVKEGDSLAGAVGAASGKVTEFEKAIIQAAERSASVDIMLARLAGFLEEEQRVVERVRAALIYPSIVLVTGLCVAGLMLGLLVPRARQIIGASNVAMPLLTRMVIAFGNAVLTWGWAVLVALAGAGWWFFRRMRVVAEAREEWDRHMFGMPVIGRGYTLLANLRFAQTMSLLVGGGVSALEALPLAGRATGSPWIVRLAGEQAERVRHGARLSDAVREIPPLASHLPGWIQVGEAGGGLEKLLESAARRNQDQFDAYVRKALAWLEPVLILFIGGFVLLITLSVLLPILSMTRGLR